MGIDLLVPRLLYSYGHVLALIYVRCGDPKLVDRGLSKHRQDKDCRQCLNIQAYRAFYCRQIERVCRRLLSIVNQSGALLSTAFSSVEPQWLELSAVLDF